MSEAALEELLVLSSIYCGRGEFQLLQQSADGVLFQINSAVGGHVGPDVSLSFHLHPSYPAACLPEVSVSSTRLSRSQCQYVRRELLERAAALPREAMVHQLVESLQCMELTEDYGGGEQRVEQRDEEEWTSVLLLDHIRSRNHYIRLLERWTHQLQLTGRLLLGRSILVILQGARPDIKEFCSLLKTVKVDVDSSGKKCKERMMKVLIETPLTSSSGHRVQGLVVREYLSLPELSAAFQELQLIELYEQILPSLTEWHHTGSE